MNELQHATDLFVEAILNTSIYKDYIIKRDTIKQYPDLKDKIDEYRIRRFELQNNDEDFDLYDKMDALENEFQEIKENPIVSDFLDAELELCRMIQAIDNKIINCLCFE